MAYAFKAEPARFQLLSGGVVKYHITRDLDGPLSAQCWPVVVPWEMLAQAPISAKLTLVKHGHATGAASVEILLGGTSDPVGIASGACR